MLPHKGVDTQAIIYLGSLTVIKYIDFSTKPDFLCDWEDFCECPLTIKYGCGRWDD